MFVIGQVFCEHFPVDLCITFVMISQVPLEDAMGKLIVYCRAVSYKKNEVSDDCCEMYSFNDGSAQDFISGHPRGTRNQMSLLYENIKGIMHTHPPF